jgi:cation diffusion facilitator family transporter
VHLERAAIIEQETLVLAAALHAFDAAPDGERNSIGGKAPREGGVQDVDRGDAPTDRHPLDDARGALDLGELGHGGTVAAARGTLKLTRMPGGGENPRVETPNRVLSLPERAARVPGVRRTLLVILALNLLVVGVKVFVGIRTGALSVLGAALESTLDMLNNVVGILLVRLAAIGPDENHPYGHEKFETLGALGIVGFLSISCFELLREGITRVAAGAVPAAPSVADLVLIALTMVVNVFVVWYERRRGRELQSAFLLADAAHTNTDIYVTAAALGSLLLTRAGFGIIDPVLSVVVAIIIAWNGYQIVRGTVPVLVDERAVDADEVRRVVAGIAEVVEVRHVRTRTSASGLIMAEVTITVDGLTSVAHAHEVADAVEARIAEALGESDVVVHVEPT